MPQVLELHDDVPAAEAAERLAISPLAVRQQIHGGSLRGRQRAGRWFVPIAELDRVSKLPRMPGRPYDQGPAWALIALASGNEHESGLSPARVSQLRRALLDVNDIDGLLYRLRHRADRQLNYVHPSLLNDVLADDRIVLGGPSALPRESIDLVDGQLPEEVYISGDNWGSVAEEHAIQDADDLANLVVHVVEPGPVLHNGQLPDLAVALDLFESGDPRAQYAARVAWRVALAH